MSEEFSSKLKQTFEDIRTMKVRGAGRIARAAVSALKDEIFYVSDSSPEEFYKRMQAAANYLKSSRPTAVSLPNGINTVIKSIQKGIAQGLDLKSLKEYVAKEAETFIQKSIEAQKKIGEIGAKRIVNGDTVLTHCNSQSAISVIETAFKEGKQIKIFATETRPRFQGRLTAAYLADHGIDVTLIPDTAARLYMRKVDKVVVGADAIAVNGAVVNKIGTSQIAALAFESRTRVMVAAETYKISPQTYWGELIEIEMRSPYEVAPKSWLDRHPRIKVMNPAFDVTPPQYIDFIVTEKGIYPPQGIIMLFKELYELA
ncbi:MAG: ribose 1,5-bisphosphate isomerase [Nitrososphaeria archaeon]|jgi:ribose 1,5-bisphosphate isomerase (EC 5.3.1.-)